MLSLSLLHKAQVRKHINGLLNWNMSQVFNFPKEASKQRHSLLRELPLSKSLWIEVKKNTKETDKISRKDWQENTPEEWHAQTLLSGKLGLTWTLDDIQQGNKIFALSIAKFSRKI